MVRRNLDLWAIIALAGFGLAVQWLPVINIVRLASGLGLVMWSPGYALASALFPRRLPGWPERILFSLGLSLATAILGAVILNRSAVGLQTSVWAGLFVIVTATASLVAAQRRGHQADEEPARLPARRLARTQWTLLWLAALLTVGAVGLVRAPLPTTDVLGYTLLWVTPAGDASSPSIHLGMSSSELATTHYHLRATFDGRQFLDVPDITLQPGEKWERLIVLSGGQPVGGIDVVLYRLDRPGVVYRRVTLLPLSPGS